MKQIKVLFIDVDNTLLDFDEYVRSSMKNGFVKFGLPAYEPWMYDIFVIENNKLWESLERKELTFEELLKIRWNIIFEKLGMDFDGPTFEKYFRACLQENAIPVEGSYELLKSAKDKGYILCAASNGPYQQQINRLKIGQMHDFFDYIFISEQIGASKPAREFYDVAFSELNKGRDIPFQPEECMMIGDSLTSDMTGGIQYGMKTCYYQRSDKSFDNYPVDYVVKDLVDVPL